MTSRIRINETYLPLLDWELPVRFVELYGGRDSGKSVFASQALALKAIQYRRRVVVMRKVATTIMKSVWERMRSALSDLGVPYRQNKTERSLLLPGGSQFWFIGADDPEKLKSIEEVTDYWLEEATEFTEADFNTVNIGLRANVSPGPQVWLTHNPIPEIPGFRHWIQERFLDVPHELSKLAVHDDIVVLRTWYKDNAFVSDASAKELERLKATNPSLYRMWTLGEFTTLEGVILDGNWDIVASVPEGVKYVGAGLDFGFANDPAAVVRIWKRNDEMWWEEMVYDRGLTNPDLSREMADAGLDHRYEDVVADSAEPKSIEELRQLGWSVRGAAKAPGFRRAAAQFLRSHQIHVIAGSTNLIKEFAVWSWVRDRQGNIMPEPEDKHNHLIDAGIYRTFTPQSGALGKRQVTRTRPTTAGMRNARF